MKPLRRAAIGGVTGHAYFDFSTVGDLLVVTCQCGHRCSRIAHARHVDLERMLAQPRSAVAS